MITVTYGFINVYLRTLIVKFWKKRLFMCIFLLYFFSIVYTTRLFFIYFFLCDFYTFFLVLFFYSLYNTLKKKNLSLLLIFIVFFSFLPLSFHFHFHIDCPFQFFVFQFRLLKGSEGGTKWDLRKELFNKDKVYTSKKAMIQLRIKRICSIPCTQQ